MKKYDAGMTMGLTIAFLCFAMYCLGRLHGFRMAATIVSAVVNDAFSEYHHEGPLVSGGPGPAEKENVE